jgi:hypothetical protein
MSKNLYVGNPSFQATADADITAHQVVRTTTGGHVVPATTSLRTLPFVGVALATVPSGGSVTVQIGGPIDPNFFNLGAGIACAVGVNPSGIPVRATDPTCISAPNWLGACDTSGSFTVSPYRADNLNIIDFGALEGDTSPSARSQNNAAISAAMKAIDPAGPYQLVSGSSVWIPSGSWYFANTIKITRPITLKGPGARYSSSARVFFPDGCVGVRAWHFSGQSAATDGYDSSLGPPFIKTTKFPDVSGATASGVIIDGIWFEGEGSSSLSAHGFFMTTPASVSNCVFCQ